MTPMRRRHLRALPRVAHAAAPALAFALDGELLALVPDREFSVTFVRAERRSNFRRTNLWLWFRVLALEPADAPYDGVDLALICPTKNGRFAQLSKFTRLWMRLAGRQPRKGERLSTAVFSGKLFTIRTRTVPRDHRQQPHAPTSTYSVIEDIVSVDVGGPA